MNKDSHDAPTKAAAEAAKAKVKAGNAGPDDFIAIEAERQLEKGIAFAAEQDAQAK